MWRKYEGVRRLAALVSVVIAVLAITTGAASAQLDEGEEAAEVGPALGKVAQIPEGVPIDVARDSGLDIGAVCGKVIFSFVATQADTSIITTDDEAGYSLYTVDGPIDEDNAVLAVDRCATDWQPSGFRAQIDRVTLTPGERYWVSWYQEDNSETLAINGAGLLEFVPPILSNVEYTYTRDSGPDTSVGECTQAIIGSFVADGPETEIWVNDWEQYYGLENRGHSATVATELGRTYYLGWHIEDNEDRFMLNPVSPLRRVLDDVPVIVEGEELEFTLGDGLDLDVDNVCGRLAARFTPTQRFNRIYTTDNESGFQLYTVAEPRQGFSDRPELVLDRCSLADWQRHDNPNGIGSWTQELILEPGETYWITWEQEDQTETFVIGSNDYLGSVPELPLVTEILQTRDSFAPVAVSGGCTREIIGSFVATDDILDIWAIDNEQGIALFVDESGLAEPRTGDLTLATPCDNDWEALDNGGWHISAPTEPGVRYYLGWFQEDNSEIFTLEPINPLRLPARATPVVSCLAGRGRVDMNLTNPTLADARYRLEFQGLSPRERTIVAGAAGSCAMVSRC